MSQSDAGKTDKVANNFRTPQWEKSKLWKNLAKNERIFQENKDKIEGSNVEIVSTDNWCSHELEGVSLESINGFCFKCHQNLRKDKNKATKTVEVKGG